ncbi:MAG: hypothetical protein ACXAC2_03910 [Candidatus Kariarchaeaceae archaeon]|jgi:hypothetical protein
MKYQTFFVLIGTVALLLTASFVSAHGNDDEGTDRPMGDHMGDHMGDTNYGMQMGDSGFEGYSEHMSIIGNLTLDDSISLTVSIMPSAEMQEMMEDGHMGMGSGHSNNMMDYTNTMSISLTKLVEFEDIDGDGLTSEDQIISEYLLNGSTLNEVEFIASNNSYFISSKNDTVFTMTVDLNTDNEMPYAWKWSLTINYPFNSNTSSVAMIHEVNSETISMMDMHKQMDDLRDNHMSSFDTNFGNNFMQDHHQNLPMMFSWDDFALVDGFSQNVTATVTNDVFALSMVQGSQIYYDPKIGVEPSSITTVDGILGSSNLDEFIDIINSPTGIGLIAGFVALLSVAIAAYRSKK